MPRVPTYLDPSLEGLAVLGQELLLDVAQINFAPRDDDSDQSVIVGPKTLHCFVEASCEIRVTLPHDAN